MRRNGIAQLEGNETVRRPRFEGRFRDITGTRELTGWISSEEVTPRSPRRERPRVRKTAGRKKKTTAGRKKK
jgi:hypothetical protein